MTGVSRIKLLLLVAGALVGSELIFDLCARLPLAFVDYSGPVLNVLLISLMVWLITCSAGGRWRGLGWRGPLGLPAGVGLGVAQVGAILGLAAVTGSISLAVRTVSWSELAYLAFIFAVVAYTEELLYRGTAQKLLYQVAGPYGALAVASMLFAAAHLSNPYARPDLTGLTVLFTASWFAGALYLGTGSLWAPIGWHFGWNLAQMAFGPMISYGGSGWAVPGLFGIESWPLSAAVMGAAAFAATCWALSAHRRVSADTTPS